MQFKRQSKAAVDVNMTPLIDVVFLLLIFFMVSTSFTKETELTLTRPEAVYAKETPENREALSIVVDALGAYHIDGVAMSDESYETLASAIKNLANNNLDKPVEIYADAEAPYNKVVRLVDIAGQQGFSRIHLITQPGDET